MSAFLCVCPWGSWKGYGARPGSSFSCTSVPICKIERVTVYFRTFISCWACHHWCVRAVQTFISLGALEKASMWAVLEKGLFSKCHGGRHVSTRYKSIKGKTRRTPSEGRRWAKWPQSNSASVISSAPSETLYFAATGARCPTAHQCNK